MATSMWRTLAYANRHINLKLFRRNISFSARRYLLSEAYSCNDVWQKRLQSPVFEKIVFSEFAIQLKEKLEKQKRASVIDMDIFANKLHEMDISDTSFMEDIIKKFRYTEDAVPVYDSIVHAIIRAYLDLGLVDRLLVMIKDRVNYGLFPDYFAFNLLIDHYIKEEKFAEAASLAYEMMLQEDFNHPVSFLLSLYATVKHLHVNKVDERTAEPIPEDKGEEEWIPVKYIRQPHYDDHFDIKDERFLLGKTLNMLGRYIKDDEVLRNSLRLIGKGLWHKFGKGLFLMEELAKTKKKNSILNEALIRFDRCLENAEVKDPDAPEKEQGLLTVDDEIYNLRLTPDAREELTTECEEMWYKLRWNDQVIEPGDDLMERVEKLVKEELPKYEAADVKEQTTMFEEWSAKRVQLLEEQVKKYIREQKEAEIEEKLKELQEKEELLSFFEKRDEIELAKERAPEEKPPKVEEDEETLRAKRIKRRKFRHHV